MRSLSPSVSTFSSRLAKKGREIMLQQWCREWREQVTLTEDPPRIVQCPGWSRHSPGQVWGSPEWKSLEQKRDVGKTEARGQTWPRSYIWDYNLDHPDTFFCCQKQYKWQSCCWSTRAPVILRANSNWMAGGHCLDPKATLSYPSGETVLTKLFRSRRQYSNFDSWWHKVLQILPWIL